MTDEQQLSMVEADAAAVESVERQREGERPAQEEIDIPVHPVAALFPMLSDRELDDLAADIAENGLLHPIVLDSEGQIIDGRNRYTACRRAGVPLSFEQLDGKEPVAFILSQNLARRHMTAGQRAMALALATENLTVKFHGGEAAAALGISASMLSMARSVRDYARDMAEKVLAGTMEIRPAWEEAQRRKEAALGEEAKLRRLQRYAPDLAALVAEGKLTLAAAEMEMAQRRAAEEQRKEEARRYRVGLTQDWLDILSKLDPRALGPDDNARQWLACDPALLGRTDDVSAERARLCADTLLRYAAMKEEQDVAESADSY